VRRQRVSPTAIGCTPPVFLGIRVRETVENSVRCGGGSEHDEERMIHCEIEEQTEGQFGEVRMSSRCEARRADGLGALSGWNE
jgi:hypothetical protein